MKIKKGILLQKMGETYVAYDNNTSTLHELNETGYRILKGIEESKKKGEIVKKLSKEFSVDREKATKDYDDFTSLLEKRELIER